MSLPYAFDDHEDTDRRYGMVAENAADEAAAIDAGYGCGVCLDHEWLAYTDGSEGPCPNCRPYPPESANRAAATVTSVHLHAHRPHAREVDWYADNPATVFVTLGPLVVQVASVTVAESLAGLFTEAARTLDELADLDARTEPDGNQ